MTSGAAAMVREKVLLPDRGGAALSVTVTVTELVPAALGVPVICPVPALMLKPAGNPVADQL
jgi:hypothetical protein